MNLTPSPLWIFYDDEEESEANGDDADDDDDEKAVANSKVVSEFGRKCDLEAIQAKGHDSYSQARKLVNKYKYKWPLVPFSDFDKFCFSTNFLGLFHHLANKFIEALSLALICDKTGTWMAALSPLIRSLILPSNS